MPPLAASQDEAVPQLHRGLVELFLRGEGGFIFEGLGCQFCD